MSYWAISSQQGASHFVSSKDTRRWWINIQVNVWNIIFELRRKIWRHQWSRRQLPFKQEIFSAFFNFFFKAASLKGQVVDFLLNELFHLKTRQNILYITNNKSNGSIFKENVQYTVILHLRLRLTLLSLSLVFVCF